MARDKPAAWEPEIKYQYIINVSILKYKNFQNKNLMVQSEILETHTSKPKCSEDAL